MLQINYKADDMFIQARLLNVNVNKFRTDQLRPTLSFD